MKAAMQSLGGVMMAICLNHATGRAGSIVGVRLESVRAAKTGVEDDLTRAQARPHDFDITKQVSVPSNPNPSPCVTKSSFAASVE